MVIAIPSETHRSACPERGLGQPPNLLILNVDDVHGSVDVSAQQGSRASPITSSRTKGRSQCPANRQALLHSCGKACFDVDVHIAHRPDHAQGVMHSASRFSRRRRVGRRAQLRGYGVDSIDVHAGIAADFQLETADSPRRDYPATRRAIASGASCEIAR